MRIDGGCRRFLLPDIGDDAGDRCARHLRANLGQRRVHRGAVAVDQRDARALLAEQQPGRGADAPCPAGDDRNLVAETAHVFLHAHSRR